MHTCTHAHADRRARTRASAHACSHAHARMFDTHEPLPSANGSTGHPLLTNPKPAKATLAQGQFRYRQA
eukprot:11467651-Alexandrium_andersonii.AAC.1